MDHICITCDRIAELKHAVFSHICCVSMTCCGTYAEICDSMKLKSDLVDIMQPTQVILPMLDRCNLARIEPKFSYPLCLSQKSLSGSATALYFTYICKLSCILHTGQHDHVHNN